jgi:hypothetical protein
MSLHGSEVPRFPFQLEGCLYSLQQVLEGPLAGVAGRTPDVFDVLGDGRPPLSAATFRQVLPETPEQDVARRLTLGRVEINFWS